MQKYMVYFKLLLCDHRSMPVRQHLFTIRNQFLFEQLQFAHMSLHSRIHRI